MILTNMNKEILEKFEHDHHFIIDSGQAEKRTKMVVLLTLLMMIFEIAGGYLFGSMALLADGWHMGTHVTDLHIWRVGPKDFAAVISLVAKKHESLERYKEIIRYEFPALTHVSIEIAGI